MVEFAPSTGGLALWVRHQDVPEVGRARPAMTDGNTVFYTADFDNLPLAEQAGVVAHEVLHVALRHPQRFLDLQSLLGDVDLQLFNICADAIVNSTLGHLSWLRLPPSSVFLDQVLASVLGLKVDVETALLHWDVERLYRAIDDRRTADQSRRQQRGQNSQSSASASGEQPKRPSPPQAMAEPSHARMREDRTHHARVRDDGTHHARVRDDGTRSAQVRVLGTRSHADLAPDTRSQQTPEAEADHAREQNERLLRAHVNDGTFSMLRTLIADLPRVRIPWEQVLRTRLARNLARKTDLSWSRPTRSYIANQGRIGPNRRLPWEPGTASTKTVPRLAVIVDVSGSINADLMQRFSREIEAIARRQEAGLVLIIGDRQVRRVEVFKPGRIDLQNIDFRGGGGTDFSPLLQEADRHRPDIAVVLTDLQGPADFRPRWPVIWAVPDSHADAVPPFGRKLALSD